MNKTIAKDEAFSPELHSIDECLLELEKYGCPHITKSPSGYWYSGINVFVTGDGVSFEVRYSRAKTPKEAINGVYKRLMIAMEKLQTTQH